MERGSDGEFEMDVETKRQIPCPTLKRMRCSFVHKGLDMEFEMTTKQAVNFLVQLWIKFKFEVLIIFQHPSRLFREVN